MDASHQQAMIQGIDESTIPSPTMSHLTDISSIDESDVDSTMSPGPMESTAIDVDLQSTCGKIILAYLVPFS